MLSQCPFAWDRMRQAKSVLLNMSQSNKQFEYLFHCESVREQYNQVHSGVPSEDVIRDVWDGTNMRENLLFKTEASSLGLILYQDAFEVVNPLGSGKKKHKIRAVYLTLADILPQNRSSIDHMQLENFSRSLHFCRYCEIDRKMFQTDPISRGTNKTTQSYRDHVLNNDG